MGWLLCWAAVGALAIALGARVTVPFEPVPMTLQTLAVLGVGGLLGRGVGACATALYLGLVLAGLPVLSDGAAAPGSAFLELKSGGYVVGFIAAAFIAGFSGRSVLQSLLVMALAHVVILVIGTSWLAAHIGWRGAFEYGLRPFLWGALVKTVVAAALVQHFVERKRPR
jgi:biotin transport system substrate-specific component